MTKTETCVPEIPEPQSQEKHVQRARFAEYRLKLAAYQIHLSQEPDATIFMPVEAVRVSDVADTWGAPRGGGHSYEGQDIFAPRGTAIYSVTRGIVYRYRIGRNNLDGNIFFIAGAGGRRYYYAYLEDRADIQ